MEYCFLKGFLVVFVIQHYTSEGLSTSNQSSPVVTLQDDEPLHPEPEVPPADVVPVVAPPSIMDVQQAVQAASEQVESRGAEEVLKVLMEKVVEAAMGQVERRGEAKRDETAVQEGVTENVLGADTKAEVEKKEVEGEYVGAKEEDTIVGKQQAEAERDVFKNVAEKEKEVVKWEGEIAARSMEETITGIENGGREGVEEVINESLDTDVSQEVVKETVAASEETGQNVTINETEVEDNNEQVVMSKEKGAHEPQTHQAEETPTVVKVALGGEFAQESVEKSTLVMFGVEQTGDVGRKEEALVEKTQVDEKEGEVTITLDSYETGTKHTVVGELEEEEEEENLVDHVEGAEVENKQGHTVVEGGVAKEKKADGTDVTKAAEGEKDGESEISDTLLNEGGDRQAGEAEEARVALETPHGTETEDQEMLVISAPLPEDGAEVSMEQSLENQAPTLSPSLGGVETGENTFDHAKFNHGNEIITPTNDLLPRNPVVAKPTLDNFVKDVLVGHTQAEGDKPGETNELVEDTRGTPDTSELEAWKIGAISAAVFLVLETLVIFYILKCRNKNSTPALQRPCEEGSVEPEEATGGDCSDATRPANNEDTEQIAARHPPNMASTSIHNKEQQEEEHAIAMSDITSSFTQQSANTGPGPNCSQDLRTSIL